MYQWKFQNPPQQDNWVKGFTTQTIKNYDPKDKSNHIGVDYIKLENNGSICRLHLKFKNSEKEDRFIELLGEKVNFVGAIRRASTIKHFSIMGQPIDLITDNLKSIGLILRTIHQSLPFDNSDKKEMITFFNLPEDAFENSHSYETCTIS